MPSRYELIKTAALSVRQTGTIPPGDPDIAVCAFGLVSPLGVLQLVASETGLDGPAALTTNSPTAGLGYSAGAGGAVTQLTDKSTGVTLNKVTGAITMNNASLADATTVTFTVTDSAIGANDVPSAVHKNAGTAGAYLVWAHSPAAGSFKISVRNVSGGALVEAIVLQFVIIKGAIA